MDVCPSVRLAGMTDQDAPDDVEVDEDGDDDDDGWQVYVTQFEDDVASVLINMAAPTEIDLTEFPHLLLVRVPLKDARDDGLQNQEENETLFAIEDALAEALSEKLSAVYVGRVTTQGRREFAYYAPEHEAFKPTLQAVMKGFAGYSNFGFMHVEEPEWDYYGNVLYPNPLEYQGIMNRMVIQNLAEHGDPLTAERKVDHVLGFETAEGRTAFVAEVEPLGFVVQQTSDGDEEGERDPDAPQFILELGFEQAVDPETVDEVVFDLIERAEPHKGIYDGWGCMIVSDEA